MKTISLLACSVLAWSPAAFAEAPAKPMVTLSVKTHVLESNSDLRGKGGSSKRKILTLRVEITNPAATAVEGATLSGTALVRRSGDLKERLVKELLGTVKIEPLKPNQRITVDLGKIELHELEWRARKFEETLEEWQVVCERAGTEIGKAESSEKYQNLEKDAVTPETERKAGGHKRRARNT